MSETLTDLMKLAAQRHDASGRRLAEIAAGNGMDITYTTINHILSGTYRSRPGTKTLAAVAYLAGVELDRVYSAAGVESPGRPFAEDLPPGADYLTGRQRAAVIEVIRAMLEPRSVGVAGGDELLLAVSEMAEQDGAHSLEDRLASLEQAEEIIRRSRRMTAEAKGFAAELIANARANLRQDSTG